MKISLVPALAVLPLLPASAQQDPPAPTAADVAAAQYALQIRQFKDQLAEQDLKHRNEMAALRASLAEKETTAREAELQALQHEKEMATLQAAIATQAKTEREAIFGETLKPRDGSITVNSTAEAMVVAQARLEMTARAIADEATNVVPAASRIYLVPGFPPADFQAARSTLRLITEDVRLIVHGTPNVTDGLISLTKKLREKHESPPKAAEKKPALPPVPDGIQGMNATFGAAGSSSLTAGVDVVQSALSLLALARVNRTFGGVTLTADNNAFLATMVSELAALDNPPAVQLGLEGESLGETSLMDRFMELDSSMSKAGFEIAAAAKRLKEQEGLLAEEKKIHAAAEEIADNPAAPEPGRSEAIALRDLLKPKIDDREKYIKALTGLKESTEKLVKRGTEHLAALEKGKVLGVDVGKLLDVEDYNRSLRKGRILFVNVNNVAGTNLTKQNLLTNSFQAGAGVSASYVLVGPNFSTIKADTIYGYKGFYRVRDRKAGEIPAHPSVVRAETGTNPVIEEEAESARRRKPWGGPRSK